MENQKKKWFQFRAFVSLLTGFSFILMDLTGCILFITPPGRVANWAGWTFWGFTKDQWVALHIWFSLLFVVACLFHLYLNFGAIVNYLKITGSKAYRFRFEWLAALAVCALIFAGTHLQIRPFQSLLRFQDRVKNGWEDRSSSGPAAHAELWPLAQLAEETDTPLDTILSNLGVDSPEITLADLAEQTGQTPDQLYRQALGQAEPRSRTHSGRGEGGRQGGQGQGYGQMTLGEVCQQAGLDPDKAVGILKEQGITAEPDMTMRQIADQHGLHPSRLREMLSIPEF